MTYLQIEVNFVISPSHLSEVRVYIILYVFSFCHISTIQFDLKGMYIHMTKFWLKCNLQEKGIGIDSES